MATADFTASGESNAIITAIRVQVAVGAGDANSEITTDGYRLVPGSALGDSSSNTAARGYRVAVADAVGEAESDAFAARLGPITDPENYTWTNLAINPSGEGDDSSTWTASNGIVDFIYAAT